MEEKKTGVGITPRVIVPEGRSYAPWTPKQVQALNAWQQAGHVHEFTCPAFHENKDTGRVLVATEQGWSCPGCRFTQDWAHNFMLDGAPPLPFSKPMHTPEQRLQFLEQVALRADALLKSFAEFGLDGTAIGEDVQALEDSLKPLQHLPVGSAPLHAPYRSVTLIYKDGSKEQVASNATITLEHKGKMFWLQSPGVFTEEI